MQLYARLNILGGHSVRLPRGDLNNVLRLDNDPVSRARSWAEQGADVIHVVDLDAAAHRDYRNRELIDEMIKNISVPIQVAGGIRSPKEAARLIDQGAYRVVMGTAAIEDQNMVWDLCRENPSKIVVSLDVRPDEEIAIRGWAVNSGRYLEEVLSEMSDAGVTSFLIAEAGRDALVEQPNYQILNSALSLVDDDIIAAGGVRNLDDLRAIASTGVDGKRVKGVIVGREVTHGRFTIEEAKRVLAEVASQPASSSPPETTSAAATVNKAAAEQADLYRRLAADLEKAGSHARNGSHALLSSNPAKANGHLVSVEGYLVRARRTIDALAEAATDGPVPD